VFEEAKLTKSVSYLAMSVLAILAVPAAANATLVESPGISGSPLLDLNNGTPAGLYSGSNLIASLSGGTILTIGNPNTAAQPVGTSGNFLAAGPSDNGNATLSFLSPTAELSFLWGSPDTYNTLVVHTTTNAAGYTFTAAGAGVTPPNGNQAFAEYVGFIASGGELITSVDFGSTSNAFEVSNFAVSAVPEPATWAMMVIGFLGVGFLAYRRKTPVSFRMV